MKLEDRLALQVDRVKALTYLTEVKDLLEFDKEFKLLKDLSEQYHKTFGKYYVFPKYEPK